MEDLNTAKKILKEGGIIIFPTDTAFGVGCRIDNRKAIERIFKIRQRPKTQAVPVLVSSIKMAQKYLQPLPSTVEKLMKKHWPGALTIVYLCKKDQVPSPVRAGGLTLGVRMPNHPQVLSIIKSLRVPILGPSANIHGQATPYKFEDLDQNFVKEVDYVLPGQSLVGMASTVIDCSRLPWKIIRQGALKIEGLVKKILIIDTSDRSQTVVGLAVGKRKIFLKGETGGLKSQNLLPLIDKILKKNQIKLEDLTAIKVSLGPGSFTGLRVGVTVANTLGWFLKIPVNGKRALFLPQYSY
jgi:L-threonylcarbamoyladenylate synthase